MGNYYQGLPAVGVKLCKPRFNHAGIETPAGVGIHILSGGHDPARVGVKKIRGHDPDGVGVKNISCITNQRGRGEIFCLGFNLAGVCRKKYLGFEALTPPGSGSKNGPGFRVNAESIPLPRFSQKLGSKTGV